MPATVASPIGDEAHSHLTKQPIFDDEPMHSLGECLAMLPTTISLFIVLAIVALVGWGIHLLKLPRWVAGSGYTAIVASAGALILNFTLTLTGHPWFVYGGLAAP